MQNGTTHIVFFVITNPEGRPIIGSNVSDFKVGVQRVQLLKPDIKDPKLEPGTWTVDITASSVSTRIRCVIIINIFMTKRLRQGIFFSFH